MLRTMTYVAAWMVASAAAPMVAQECTDTFDATSVGLRGRFEQTFVFEAGDVSPGLQTGSLLITSVGETEPTLPDLEGTWLALNRCQFSVWTVSQTGATGIARGSGITFGDQLIGVLQISRFEGSVNGVFVVSGNATIMEPEEPLPEEETDPMIGTAAASSVPTPARQVVR